MASTSKDFIFQPFKVIQVTYRNNVIPRPRSGHRIVCDDNNVYCFGGYNPTPPQSRHSWENSTWSIEQPLFKELWSFSIATNKWKLHKVVENMPEELASNAMCMNGRYLLIFGGTGAPFGDKCSNDLIVWLTGPNDARLQIADANGPRPPGQYGQAVLCHDGYFYSIGGTNGFSYNCDIYRLNLNTLVWEPVFVGTGQEDEPFGRYRHEVVQDNNKLYIIGGGTGQWAFELTEVPCFDLNTKTWSILKPKPDGSDCGENGTSPQARKCHGAVQINSPDGVQVFVAGGSDGQSVFDDVWRLDINTLQWTLMRKTVIPHPLYFHSTAVTSNGCMYMFGGIEPQAGSMSRNNVMYKVWLCIPKLSEMCWEAVLSIFPDLDEKDRSELLSMGIPVHFVDRLLPSVQ